MKLVACLEAQMAGRQAAETHEKLQKAEEKLRAASAEREKEENQMRGRPMGPADRQKLRDDVFREARASATQRLIGPRRSAVHLRLLGVKCQECRRAPIRL